jgi:pimeloyl-ACP methyl ester carboxylesterase
MIGTALGSNLILRFASLYPERVEKMFISNVTSFLDYRILYRLQSWLRVLECCDYDTLFAVCLPHLATNSSLRQGLDIPFLKDLLFKNKSRDNLIALFQAALSRDDFHLDYARITHPCLILQATRDSFISIEHGRRAKIKLPQARYLEIEAGHFIYLEKRDELIALQRDFLG